MSCIHIWTIMYVLTHINRSIFELPKMGQNKTMSVIVFPIYSGTYHPKLQLFLRLP